METTTWKKLTKNDLVRMKLPKRFWDVGIDGINADKVGNVSPKEIVVRYIKQMDRMLENGYGLLLWGPNGSGKTAIAAIIAKWFRRRTGTTVLFIEAAKLKGFVANKEYFDEDETYEQRSHTVDVLVLDDLGKGVLDSKGFGERIIDELIRTRNANKLVTIITTNATPTGDKETLSQILMPSTMSAIKEHTHPVCVIGKDRREEIASRIESEVGFYN